MAKTLAPDDESVLAGLGYAQRLDRSLSRIGLIALQFSYISVLTTMFLLFGFAYGFAGPSLVWPWATFFAGQMLVTLLFCELASRYPVAGSVYNWSKQLGAPYMSWMAGWMVVLLGPITLAAVALPAQSILPAISATFQVIGPASSPTAVTENTVLLGGILVIVVSVINCARVRLVGRVNNFTVLVEFVVCALLVILFFAHAQRSPAVLVNTLGTGAGHSWGYFGAFLVASLLGGYQFYGMDTASTLGEETLDARRRAPRSILLAMGASFVVGLLLIVAVEMAIPKLSDPNVAALGLPYLVDKVLGSGLGDLLLVGALLAVIGCALAVQAGGVRILFGMARDRQLPGAPRTAHLSRTTQAAVLPTLLVGAVAIGLLAINITSTEIINIVSSAAIATCAIAYLFVTIPLLTARLRGTWPGNAAANSGYFSLGRFGLVINIAAVLWGVAIVVNLLWPRQAIFDPVAPHHWYFQYGPILYIAVVVLGGSIYYGLSRSRRGEILPEHSRES